MVSVAHVSKRGQLSGYFRFHVRGRAGRIACRPVAWKAATRIEPGRTSFANLLRTTCLERMRDAGLLMAGKVETDLLENARWAAALRQGCRSMAAGRTIEAMAVCSKLNDCGRAVSATVREGVEVRSRSEAQISSLVTGLPRECDSEMLSHRWLAYIKRIGRPLIRRSKRASTNLQGTTFRIPRPVN